jgi:hypothetical protein
LLKEKFTWIVGCHLSPLNTFKDKSSHQVFRLCSITKTDDGKSAQHETQLLEIGTSKIQGAGRGIFAAKSFEKGDIISVYLGKKSTDISPYSLEIKNMFISLDKEEMWLGAHFMNDHNFKTVARRRIRKVGRPPSNNAYFEGIIVRARVQIRQGDEITVGYNNKN